MATRLCCSSLVATTSQSLARKTLNENMGEKRGKTNPTKASPKRQTTTDEANSEERAQVSAMHRLYYKNSSIILENEGDGMGRKEVDAVTEETRKRKK
ncbi:hypothetical protein GOBAR_AA08556 [Gossypium barbadense]|uniref:Uncharacterized protein n=1 Tax=Gossypium barbadense TaxID=3634 RepID=A0A2P5Y920_GOSBA|nr:hypothetical protein GOBAR_AA08556 [Gossypium barbadense]